MTETILATNLLFSTLIFWIIARFYLLPKLSGSTSYSFLMPMLLLHATRHLGLMFLEPGATYSGLPDKFAYPAAIGDFIASILALLCILSVVKKFKYSRSLLWIFNFEGSLDLFAAILLATYYQASHFMGPAYWIPAFWVPSLLVTHFIIFKILAKGWPIYDKAPGHF